MNNTLTPQGLSAPSFRHGSAGFSLIEMMISMAIGLVILTAIVSIFVNTSNSRSEIERTSRQIENGRYAVELLSGDLRMAGFYGELNVGTVAPGGLQDPCGTAVATLVAAIPLHLQGNTNALGSTTKPSCVPNTVKDGTDIVVVRRTRGCVAGVAGCAAAVAGAPYVQVSLCESEAPTTPYVLGLQGTATFNLRTRDCATVAGTRQYLEHIYFISTDNGSGVAVPTLKRMEFTGGGYTETPLVEGIEFFKITYGIDNDNDGVVDVVTADPSTENNWSNVITAQIYILARNIEPSWGYTDTKTYTLGLTAAGAPFTVGPFASPLNTFRRHVYTSTIRIVNPASRRDTP